MSAPFLQTDRLQLRLIQSSDLEAIHAIHRLPESDQYNTLGIPKDLAVTEAIIAPWIKAHEAKPLLRHTIAVESLSDVGGPMLGLLGFNVGQAKYKRAEIWYIFHPDFWGQGYATESVEALLKYGFEELKLHRIGAGVAVENAASIKLLERVGMLREGRCRKILPLKTGWSDNFEYAMLEEDWFVRE